MNVYKYNKTKKKKLRDFFDFRLFPKGKHFLKKQKNSSKRKFFKLFSFCLCFFLGISFLTVFALKRGFFESRHKIENYEDYDKLIWPVVMQDPPTFNEEIPLDEKIKIKASLWDTAVNSKKESFNYDEDDMLILSAKDVQKSYEKLFGKEINYKEIESIRDPFYKFNRFQKNFSVKVMSGTNFFYPHTINAFWEKDNLILKVEYFIPQNQFDEFMNPTVKIKTEKFANYILKKNKKTGRLYVYSVF